jgi:hypothetical protein
MGENLTELSQTDASHIAGDSKRAYLLLNLRMACLYETPEKRYPFFSSLPYG